MQLCGTDDLETVMSALLCGRGTEGSGMQKEGFMEGETYVL